MSNINSEEEVIANNTIKNIVDYIDKKVDILEVIKNIKIFIENYENKDNEEVIMIVKSQMKNINYKSEIEDQQNEIKSFYNLFTDKDLKNFFLDIYDLYITLCVERKYLKNIHSYEVKIFYKLLNKKSKYSVKIINNVYLFHIITTIYKFINYSIKNIEDYLDSINQILVKENINKENLDSMYVLNKEIPQIQLKDPQKNLYQQPENIKQEQRDQQQLKQQQLLQLQEPQPQQQLPQPQPQPQLLKQQQLQQQQELQQQQDQNKQNFNKVNTSLQIQQPKQQELQQQKLQQQKLLQQELQQRQLKLKQQLQQLQEPQLLKQQQDQNKQNFNKVNTSLQIQQPKQQELQQQEQELQQQKLLQQQKQLKQQQLKRKEQEQTELENDLEMFVNENNMQKIIQDMDIYLKNKIKEKNDLDRHLNNLKNDLLSINTNNEDNLYIKENINRYELQKINLDKEIVELNNKLRQTKNDLNNGHKSQYNFFSDTQNYNLNQSHISHLSPKNLSFQSNQQIYDQSKSFNTSLKDFYNNCEELNELIPEVNIENIDTFYITKQAILLFYIALKYKNKYTNYINNNDKKLMHHFYNNFKNSNDKINNKYILLINEINKYQ